MRIRVQNFQSIKDAEIEVSGLTVVTGTNNSGKTALIRALSGVFTNASSDALVRHGEESLTVSLYFSESDSLIWTKGAKVKPTYVLNGHKIHPGRQPPPELSRYGISPVEAGDNLTWPQIAQQFTGQVYLLDLPGAALAEAISDVARVSLLNDALYLAESDKRSANAELKIRRKDYIALEQELSFYDPLFPLESNIESLIVREQEILKLQSTLIALQTLSNRLKTQRAIVSKLQEINQIQKPTSQPPSTDTLTELRRIKARMDLTKETVSKLQSVSVYVPPPIPDFQIKLLESLQGLSKRMRGLSQVRKPPMEIPKLDKLIKAQTVHAMLTGLSKERHKAKGQLTTLENTMSSVDSELKSIQSDLDRTLGDSGSCPVCRQNVDHKHD